MKNKDANQPPSLEASTELVKIIQQRQSVRAFLPQKVSAETIEKILGIARFAPSGVNTQPWKVAVLGPEHRKKISQAIIKAREAKIPENPDYHYYPTEWKEPYKSRRKACGMALYGALNINVADTESRKVQWYKNYSFFDAPIALIFYIEASLGKGSWLDAGMFIQNVMLSARCFGLESCAQAALAEYPDIIRQILAIDEEHHIICAMALGYADWSNPINQYRTSRTAVVDFTRWYD